MKNARDPHLDHAEALSLLIVIRLYDDRGVLDAELAAALERLLREFVEAEGIKIGKIIHAVRVAEPVGHGFDEAALQAGVAGIDQLGPARLRVDAQQPAGGVGAGHHPAGRVDPLGPEVVEILDHDQVGDALRAATPGPRAGTCGRS